MTTATLAEGTGQALLDDILAHPEDDGLRLIYADWLEEFGGEPERAGVVRACVRKQAAALCVRSRVGGVWDANNGGLAPRGFAAHARRILPPPPPVSHRPRAVLWFSYGLLAEVRGVPLGWWQRHGPALVRQHPLTRVELSGFSPQQWERRVVSNLPEGADGRWFWCVTASRGWADPASHWVPDEVRRSPVWTRAKWYCGTPTYGTPREACDALSEALLLGAKDAARALKNPTANPTMA